MGSRIDNPSYYRARAEEAKTIADQMTHPESRRVMESIALSYLTLARFAEHRQSERRLKVLASMNRRRKLGTG
jgi:hypothetical protein